jgi:hypothetical protein
MKKNILIISILLAFLSQSYGQNDPPVAVNDTVSGYTGYPVYITSSFLLKNDYDPNGDSIYVHKVIGAETVNDTTWKIVLYPIATYDSIVTKSYWIKDENGASSQLAKIIIIIKTHAHYDSLDINNINALISPFGNHFWDSYRSRFEVPKGSGKTAIFNHVMWIGGFDSTDMLHLAAERYRQAGIDYYAGPISSVYDSTYDLKWNRVWKVNKTDIQYHLNNFSNPGYEPIDAIKNWPAHGNVLLGQSANIAPFYDTNLDGIYEPYLGDYPLIRGDQSIFFVFNDARSNHTESKGQILGVEIHGMAYEFDRSDDSVLNNTLFMHYDIMNRSSINYHDTYLGFFTDFDLGFEDDDYIGCDVTNGMMYAYNGYPVDGNGEAWAYGEHPPVISQEILGGPYFEPNGLDDPSGGCDFSINGLNFGDGTADNERMGMTNFIYFNNSLSGVPIYMSDPEIAPDYYNMMQSRWKDGTHLIFGGNGHASTGGVGPECDFMFPGNSDTLCNWGTHGVMPNGGYNQNGLYWTESSAMNLPSDRRGTSSIGPFNFNAGQSVPLDYCFTFTRDYSGNNNSSLALLRERVAGYKPNFRSIIEFLPASSVEEQGQSIPMDVFPNPVRDILTVGIHSSKIQQYELCTINGQFLLTGYFVPGNNPLNMKSLSPGVYLLKCGSHIARIIKM